MIATQIITKIAISRAKLVIGVPSIEVQKMLSQIVRNAFQKRKIATNRSKVQKYKLVQLCPQQF